MSWRNAQNLKVKFAEEAIVKARDLCAREPPLKRYKAALERLFKGMPWNEDGEIVTLLPILRDNYEIPLYIESLARNYRRKVYQYVIWGEWPVAIYAHVASTLNTLDNYYYTVYGETQSYKIRKLLGNQHENINNTLVGLARILSAQVTDREQCEFHLRKMEDTINGSMKLFAAVAFFSMALNDIDHNN